MVRDHRLLTWMKNASWISSLLGLVLFVAPLVLQESATTYANAMIGGALIVTLALLEENAEARGRIGRVFGTSTLNALLGFWFIAYPYVVPTSAIFTATSISVGILLVVVEAFNFVSASRLRAGTATL